MMRLARKAGLVAALALSACGEAAPPAHLAIPGADPVDRSGLKTNNPAVRSPYDLWIEVYGQNVPGGVPQKNNLKGKTRISLLAI